MVPARLRGLAAAWLVCGLVTLGSSSVARGDVVVTASGANTFTATDFFTIAVNGLPAGVSVTNIAIDLQGGSDPDDFWDSDQGFFGPWGFNSGVGITAGDVTFVPADGDPPPHPSVLEMIIAPGVFTNGESFTFDYDTDFTITDGDEFGEFGVTVDVTFSDGNVVNTVFIDDGISNITSVATAFHPAIPEPSMVLFLSLVVGGLVYTRYWRRKDLAQLGQHVPVLVAR